MLGWADRATGGGGGKMGLAWAAATTAETLAWAAATAG